MVYTDGKLYVSRTPCEDHKNTSCCEHYDACRLGLHLGPGVAALEHSCDEWVIGGAEEIRAMISDLTAALAEAK